MGTIKSGYNITHFPEAKQIRREVFIEEQGYTREFDEIDITAYHVVVYNDDIPAATGRMFADIDGSYHIGRIAVRKPYRKKGIGKIVIHTLEDEISRKGGGTVLLLAQLHAVSFYEKLGYRVQDGEDMDEGQPHKWMKKQIK